MSMQHAAMATDIPDIETFRQNYTDKKTQLVWCWMSSDLETPVSAYLKICGHSPYSFLLESVEGGSTLGRYSVIGTRPDLLWRCSKGAVETSQPQGRWEALEQDAKAALKDVISDSTIDVVPDDLPPMCALGVFGYIGYDMVRIDENIPDQNPDDLKIPDSVLMRPSLLVIFDNVKNRICLATPVYDHAGNSVLPADVAFNDAKKRLEKAIRQRLCIRIAT